MDYELAIENGPATIPGGTGLLLLHPSIGETDRIDTDFLKTDTDAFLVISTRTTAREVEQKLDHYEVDESRAVILDTLSVERGYSRRSSANVHYVSSPDDLGGILQRTETFLESHDGKLRVSVDSLTEMAYYADVESTLEAAAGLLELLGAHDAVGLFHLSNEVHDDETIDRFRELFDGVVTLDVDGNVLVETN
jgi:KaiC/GvpD/RAD55 family RecA-like ATPase